jgi:hypothetical protein
VLVRAVAGDRVRLVAPWLRALPDGAGFVDHTDPATGRASRLTGTDRRFPVLNTNEIGYHFHLMDQQRRGDTGRDSRTGFTVIACDDCTDDSELPVLAAFREMVRRCPHGVLVRANCPLVRLWCHTRKLSAPQATGPVVLVQRCTPARRPLGPVIAVGPLKTAEDLVTVTRWLETTPLTADGLPGRLRWTPNLQHQARRN